ncbi:MAG: hypothetical protein EOM91_06850 [Sphingobacteriia bacterium]|nr:hypothetical protein [Sphingobacteriia bacterium]NCC39811.1 hypothetical protein [Gammaproteobacteria bacterium]
MSGSMPLAPAFAPAPARALDLLLFAVGGLRCAISAEHIVAIGAPRGRAVPRLSQLLGIPRAQLPGAARILRFTSIAADSASCIEIQVEEPLSLCQIPLAAIHPLPPLIGATCALRCVRALASLAEQDGLTTCVLLLDPRQPPISSPISLRLPSSARAISPTPCEGRPIITQVLARQSSQRP